MHLKFSDQSSIELAMLDNTMSREYLRIYKHLAAVPIPFRPWENPYFLDNLTYRELVDQLVLLGKPVSVEVDRYRCLNRDQEYFNYVHKIYENSYNGNPDWLEFHAHIHMCEYYFDTSKDRDNFVILDYKEKSGPLSKPVTDEWRLNTIIEIKTGDIFVGQAELGKTPYRYWQDNEANDIKRMCELAKPWITLKPNIYIALKDFNRLDNLKVEEFQLWWEPYRTQWEQHWGLSNWTISNMFGVSLIGKTNQAELVKQKLKSNILPVKVSL